MFDHSAHPSGVCTQVSAGLVTCGSSSNGTPPEGAVAVAPPPGPNWQRILGLSDADFAALDRCSATVKTETTQVRAESAAYVNSATARKETLDQAKLQAFYEREVVAGARAMATLKAQLTPDGSRSLFQFIDDEFGPHVHTAPVGGR
jgi:hypothetical protein